MDTRPVTESDQVNTILGSSAGHSWDFQELTAIFSLLSDKTRLNILFMLSNGEKNVTWICKCLNLPQPTVSHHLGLLRSHHIVSHRREGKQIFYQLNGRVNQNSSGEISIYTNRYSITITRVAESDPVPPAGPKPAFDPSNG